MKNFTTLCFLALLGKFFIFSLEITETSHECKEIVNKSSTLRLKNYLFCNYVWEDHDSRGNTTIVNMEILPKFSRMDEYYSNLELYTWMYISWKDEHLTWNPKLFEDVGRIVVHSSEIWVPDIAVQSPGNNDANEDGLTNGPCEVRSNGKVGCAPRHRQTIRCQADFTLWPYDRQNCTLVISSLAHMGRQIKFEQLSDINQTVFMNDFAANGQWKISVSRISYEHIKSNHFENFSIPKLSVDFILDRINGQLSGRYVTPGIIMMIMTLTTVLLDPRSSERLAVACLNPLIHLLCIEDLNWALPHNGNTVPIIVLFYTNSFVLATFALLLTFVLARLRETKILAPKWISSSISLMLGNKIGQILLLNGLNPKASADIESENEDNDSLVSSESNNQRIWYYVVILLDCTSFLIFFLAYVVMWTILIPNSSMKTTITDVSW